MNTEEIMKLSQYKGHTYDIPHIKDFFGYKTDFFKKYGLETDAVIDGPAVFTNYGGYEIKTFSDYKPELWDWNDSFWLNPKYENVPVDGHVCTVYENYLDKEIPGVEDEDAEYMVEYEYMVDDATDDIIWIQCSSEE